MALKNRPVSPPQQQLQEGCPCSCRRQGHGVHGLDASHQAVEEHLLESLGGEEQQHGNKIQELPHQEDAPKIHGAKT